MEFDILTAEIRNEQGRGASRRLRRNGKVPAIVYGSDTNATAITLNHNTIYHALKREAFHTSILALNINGKTEKVVVRDFHMHAFRPEVLHLDLQRVSETEEIQMRIPLHFLNEENSHAIKIQSAHITHVNTDVEVRALAQNIPHFIEVDLAEIKAGQTIHASNLILPANVQLVTLLRGEDPVILIAGGISEVADNEITSIEAIPTTKEAE